MYTFKYRYVSVSFVRVSSRNGYERSINNTPELLTQHPLHTKKKPVMEATADDEVRDLVQRQDSNLAIQRMVRRSRRKIIAEEVERRSDDMNDRTSRSFRRQSYSLDISRASLALEADDLDELSDVSSDKQVAYFVSLLEDSENEDTSNEEIAGTNDERQPQEYRSYISSDSAKTIGSSHVSEYNDYEKMTLDEFLRLSLAGYGHNNKMSLSKILEIKRTAMTLIEKEHPRLKHISAWQLLTSVLKNRSRNEEVEKAYDIGDFAEFQEPDMTWTLDVVSKIHEVENEEGKKIFLYDIGNRCHLSPYHLRAPEEALRRIFGHRPWLWQQWALLKLEQKMRFQRDHHNDFETFDIPGYARLLWFEWLLDPRNRQFRFHLSDPRIQSSQNELFDHMMKPFYILDDIRRNDGWDFSEGFSIYTYLSIFGSGISLCLVSFLMQLTIPTIIILNSLVEANFYEAESNQGPTKVLESMFCVSDDNGTCISILLTTWMVLCIQIIYVVKVNPDASVVFQDVTGVGGYGPDKTYARCRSIRLALLERNNDRFGQLIGGMLDTYMNTLFVYVVFAINLYNILNQASPTQVLLNALALEFVFNLDEAYQTTVWWDNEKRWLKAGVIEIYLQSMFDFRSLKSRKQFQEYYGFSEDAVGICFDDDSRLFCNKWQAHSDCNNLIFMDHNEKFEYFVTEKYAKEYGCNLTYEKFKKPSVMFGLIEKIILRTWFSLTRQLDTDYGIFNRLNSYRTWSRWNKALFCGSIPNADGLFEISALGKPIVKKLLERDRHSASTPLRNFSLKESSPRSIASVRRYNALLFRNVVPRIAFSFYWGDYARSIVWLINAVLEWFTYAVEFMFPFFNLFLFLWAIYCIRVPLSALRDQEESVNRCDCKLLIPADGTCFDRAVISVYANGGSLVMNEDGFPTFQCDVLTSLLHDFGFDTTRLRNDYIAQAVPIVLSNPSIIMTACGVETLEEAIAIVQDHPVRPA